MASRYARLARPSRRASAANSGHARRLSGCGRARLRAEGLCKDERIRGRRGGSGIVRGAARDDLPPRRGIEPARRGIVLGHLEKGARGAARPRRRLERVESGTAASLTPRTGIRGEGEQLRLVRCHAAECKGAVVSDRKDSRALEKGGELRG